MGPGPGMPAVRAVRARPGDEPDRAVRARPSDEPDRAVRARPGDERDRAVRTRPGYEPDRAVPGPAAPIRTAPARLPPMPCVHSFADARNRIGRRPVGRRRQGKGDRPARRAGGCSRAIPGREQRRPHDRSRPADVQAAPDPVGHPPQEHAVRDRERRGDRSAGSDRRARRAPPAAGRHAIAADLGQRPPDHALPHDARPRRRGEARQAADRDHQAGHRPVLCRQGGAARDPGPGPARREDPQEEDRRRARAQAAVAAPVREGSAARSADDHRGVPDLRAPDGELHRGHGAARARAARRRSHGGVRGRAGRAARHRPRDLSVRHLVQSGGGSGVRRRRRRAQGHRRGLGSDEGVRDSSRGGTVPDRARRRHRRRHPRARRRVRHDDWSGAAGRDGSTWSRCATPARSTR